MPPPWIAKSGPSSFSDIAEHSMCQPGRPLPQGESQEVSSPSFWPFQSAKSRRVLLERSGPRLLALIHLVGVPVGELAVAVEAPHPEVDVAVRLVGVPLLDQRLDQGDDLGDRLRRQRLGVRAAQPEGVGVGDVGGCHLVPRSRPTACRPRARRRRSCR